MSIVIVGAGPNLGAAVARRFGREGMPVGLVARNPEKLERLAEDLAHEGITANSRPPTSATLQRPHIGDRLAGRPPRRDRSPGVLARTRGRVHEADARNDRRRCPRGARVQRPRRRRRVDDRHRADARTRLGDDPVHHRRRGDQPQPGRARESASRSPARWSTPGCSTTNSGIAASMSAIPRSAAASRQTVTTSPTTSPTCSGAPTPIAATFQSASASTRRIRQWLRPARTGTSREGRVRHRRGQRHRARHRPRVRARGRQRHRRRHRDEGNRETADMIEQAGGPSRRGAV